MIWACYCMVFLCSRAASPLSLRKRCASCCGLLLQREVLVTPCCSFGTSSCACFRSVGLEGWEVVLLFLVAQFQLCVCSPLSGEFNFINRSSGRSRSRSRSRDRNYRDSYSRDRERDSRLPSRDHHRDPNRVSRDREREARHKEDLKRDGGLFYDQDRSFYSHADGATHIL
jgi:hypothetical protein